MVNTPRQRKNALFPSLRRQLGALKFLGKKIPLESRKLLATGLIHSRLMYLMPLWGSAAQNNLMRKAQSILNTAARWTSGLPRRTRTQTLMDSNNWLNIREMVQYHRLVLIWKMTHKSRPKKLADMLERTEDLGIRIKQPRIQFTDRTFRQKGSNDWNELPEVVRKIDNIVRFKKTLKGWIKDRRDQTPDYTEELRTDPGHTSRTLHTTWTLHLLNTPQ